MKGDPLSYQFVNAMRECLGLLPLYAPGKGRTATSGAKVPVHAEPVAWGHEQRKGAVSE